jgi:hypothetical protein
VEEENRLCHPLQHVRQIVEAFDMRHLVREDAIHFRLTQGPEKVRRENDQRIQPANRHGRSDEHRRENAHPTTNAESVRHDSRMFSKCGRYQAQSATNLVKKSVAPGDTRSQEA